MNAIKTIQGRRLKIIIHITKINVSQSISFKDETKSTS